MIKLLKRVSSKETFFFKILWLILCLLFCVDNVLGQSIFYALPQNIAHGKILDSCHLIITYCCKQIIDTKKSTVVSDIQILEIGNNISKYYSYLAFRSDSLCTEWHLKHKNAQSSPRYIGITDSQNPIWTEIYKSKQGYIVYERSPGDYQYNENYDMQNWNLCDDTLTIAGYLCQKAKCRFRGRDYIAWFTIDIPIDNGPWKFGGLPGLILKIYDTRNHYIFNCTRIYQPKKVFYIKQYITDFQSMSREKIMKTDKSRHDDFTKELRFNGGNFWIMGRGDITNSIIKFPYNPIELE
jgi:GLPGLI family protein